MVIITRIIPGLMYSSFADRDQYAKSFMLERNQLEHDDLVYANTSIYPNDFIVGFVDRVDDENDCVVIREIGSQRLCNYYNESFTRINKDRLGYEVLEGLQYKTYQKVLKAFGKYTQYCTRFKSIYFDNKKCTVQARQAFSNDVSFKIEFEYDSKTSIKSIGKLLEEMEASHEPESN